MLTIKGRGKKIELCFEEKTTLQEAISQLLQESSFLKGAEGLVSYTNLTLDYNEEMAFEKETCRRAAFQRRSQSH